VSPRNRRRALALLGLVAALSVGVGTTLVLAAGDRLPDPVATHWGTDGPDGFTSLTGLLWMSGGLLAGTALVFGALTVLIAHAPRGLLVGIGAGTVVALSVLVYGLTLQQSGLTDAREAPGGGAFLLAAPLGGVLVGGGLGYLARSQPPVLPATRTPLPDDAPRLIGVHPQDVPWRRHIGMRVRLLAALVLLVLLPGALLAWVEPWLLVVPVGLAVMLLLTAQATVTVDRRGLTVRSAVLTWLHVPLERVAVAGTTTVHALTDFGGWGLRVASDGRRGFVLRSGEALRVHRIGEPDVVVTVDDAATAAAALNTLAGSLAPAG
jgi:hypothetical protein